MSNKSTQFKKGNKHSENWYKAMKEMKSWNKGTKGIMKPNSGSFKKGRIISENWEKSVKGKPAWNRGKPFSEESKKKMSNAHKGVKLSKEHCDKLKGREGNKHPMWKGGISSRYRIKTAPRPKPEICEVCGTFAGTGKMGIHYDHDHITGKFRGWLCARCNTALGMVKDNSETLIALAEYLKKSRQV